MQIHIVLLLVAFPSFMVGQQRLSRMKREETPKLKSDKGNLAAADLLKRDLLTNYDKFQRPSSNGSATKVTVRPLMHHIELDEEKSIMTVHCWMTLVWIDDKLKWNKSQSNVSQLHVAEHEIWQPDLIAYNSATGSSTDSFGYSFAHVESNGMVVWMPPAIYHVFCDLNLRKWPFDTQTCSLKIGSWAYSGLEIDLVHKEGEFEFKNYLPNAEWQFLTLTRKRNVVKYPCCPEPYVDLEYIILIKRQSPIYHALVITPITAIVILTLSIFWLPPNSGEKLVIGGVTAIIVGMFLLYFTQKISIMAGHTPLIVYFYTGSLQLVVISVVLSVIVLKLAQSNHVSPLPQVVKNCLSGKFGKCLCLGTSIAQHSLEKLSSSLEDESSDSRPVLQETQEGNFLEKHQRGRKTKEHSFYNDDWILLATAIDRICFVIYCVLFTIFAISYSV